MKKIDLKIIELYLENKYALITIAKACGKSTTYIMDLVKETGNYTYDDGIKSKPLNIKYPKIEGKKYIAVCKLTGREFHKFENNATEVTKHIKITYPELLIETANKRIDLQYKTGDYWFINYFDIKLIDEIIIETKKCDYCDWTTEDINNLSGAYGNHLKNIHDISVEKHVEKHPNDLNYFSKYKSKLDKIKLRENQTESIDYVVCKICNEKVIYINSNHLKSHGITKEQYIELYGDNLYSKSFIEKTTKNLETNRKNI